MSEDFEDLDRLYNYDKKSMKDDIIDIQVDDEKLFQESEELGKSEIFDAAISLPGSGNPPISPNRSTDQDVLVEYKKKEFEVVMAQTADLIAAHPGSKDIKFRAGSFEKHQKAVLAKRKEYLNQ